MNTTTLFSSDKQDWATPQTLFDELNKTYNFDVDVCAAEWNAKMPQYFDLTDNSLRDEPWLSMFKKKYPALYKEDRVSKPNLSCFMNPPYGAHEEVWLAKAYKEISLSTRTVAIIAARTDTKRFHKYVYKQPNVCYTFLKGRVCFEREDGARVGAPFPSMIVVFGETFQ